MIAASSLEVADNAVRRSHPFCVPKMDLNSMLLNVWARRARREAGETMTLVRRAMGLAPGES